MKKIFLKTMVFTFLTAGLLTACTSENTTGVGTETEVESEPNMGGKTGNSPGLDSIPTEETDTTNQEVIETQQ